MFYLLNNLQLEQFLPHFLQNSLIVFRQPPDEKQNELIIMFIYPSKLLLIITSAYINNSELYELTLDFFALGLASVATKRHLLVVVPAVL